MSTIFTAKKLQVQKNTGAEIIRSVKIFFGIRISTSYNRSRIVRRPTKTYEEFIFKGYDQQKPGFSKPGSFKKISIIGKN
jgi:hypothetical protein